MSMPTRTADGCEGSLSVGRMDEDHCSVRNGYGCIVGNLADYVGFMSAKGKFACLAHSLGTKSRSRDIRWPVGEG